MMRSHSLFKDKRLDKEYESLVTNMVTSGGAVINRACIKASEKKRAYRFINNENVTLKAISIDLVNQMIGNIKQVGVKEVLIAQDTMEIVRENVVERLQKNGREVLECAHTNKGMRSHSAVVMSADNGMPLGIGYLQIWGRSPNEKANVKEEDLVSDRKRQPSYYITDPETGKKRYKYNIPLMERDSESARWIEAPKEIRAAIGEDVHMIMVQDREGDMYPLLTLCSELNNFDFVVRAAKKRRIQLADGSMTGLFEYTASTAVDANYDIPVGKGPRKKGRKANADIRFGKVTVLRPHSPVYPQKSVELYFVRVSETAKTSRGVSDPIDWLLITSVPVLTIEDAQKVVGYYRRRWFIEDYHRLLKKKGFGIEDIQVETPHAFEINLAICIKSAYEVALLKKGYDSCDDRSSATLVFTPMELRIVANLNKQFNPEKKIHKNPYKTGSLAWAAWAVACEGGWSAMPSQPKPGISLSKEVLIESRLSINTSLIRNKRASFVGKG